MFQDPPGGADQVVGDGVGDQVRRRLAFLCRAVAGPDQHAPRADAPRERHIEPSIADDERTRRVDAELANRALDETRIRLAAIARKRVAGHFAVGVMRTIVIRVDPRAAGGKQLRHVAMDFVHHGFGEESARHARLVGHEDDAEAGAIEAADGVDRPRIQLDPLHAIEVADLLDQRAVAVEKHRAFGEFAHHHKTRLALSRTAAGVTPRMHRWSSGHSRSMQGRHHTSWTMTACAGCGGSGLRGAVSRSRVGPKTAVTGSPTAAATCIAPE